MSGEKTVYRATKRAFDIAASALGLVVTCPVWLAAVIGIAVNAQSWPSRLRFLPMKQYSRRIIRAVKILMPFCTICIWE